MTLGTSSFFEGKKGDPGHASRTIFLINQISGHGHLDLYARLYSACALRLGFRVVLIAEQEAGVTEWLRAHCADHVARFTFFSRAELRAARGVARRAILRARRPFDRVVSYASRRSWWVRRLRRALFPPRGVSFEPLIDEIAVAEQRQGTHADLVFFLYLDLMDDAPGACRALDDRLRSPVAGILFHPRHEGTSAGVEPERYFQCRRMRGAAFLNPHRVDAYSRAFPRLVFGTVPDVTDDALPEHAPSLVAEVRRRAGDRAVVALLGSLTPDKGLLEFIDVINRADPRQYFFLLAGEIFWQSFGAHEDFLRRFAQSPPENCLVHEGYLPDERTLNAAIAASRVLYAVYPNQRDSSNTLTKAAIFEKPLIVNEQHLMGERVRTFNLGETVRFRDTDAVLAALRRVTSRSRSEFGFAAYRGAHSLEALQAEFGSLVAAWMQ